MPTLFKKFKKKDEANYPYCIANIWENAIIIEFKSYTFITSYTSIKIEDLVTCLQDALHAIDKSRKRETKKNKSPIAITYKSGPPVAEALS